MKCLKGGRGGSNAFRDKKQNVIKGVFFLLNKACIYDCFWCVLRVITEEGPCVCSGVVG